MAGEVRGQLGGIVRRPVYQARLAAAEERHADQVQARAGRHAAVVDDPAPAVEHRDVEPGQAGPVSRRPYDRADLTGTPGPAPRRRPPRPRPRPPPRPPPPGRRSCPAAAQVSGGPPPTRWEGSRKTGR